MPVPEALALLDVLARLVHSTKLEERRPRAVLEIWNPLVGIRYALAWKLLPKRSTRR